MAASAGDRDIDLVTGGQIRAGMKAHRSRSHVRQDMLCYEHIRIIVAENACLNHQSCSPRSLFLSGLKDKKNSPGKFFPQAFKYTCSAEKHGHMRIMTAGMHHTFIPALIFCSCGFCDWQGIHVCPQPYGKASSCSLTPDETHDTCAGNACKVFYLSLIHISEPTRRTPISYAVFCL